MAYQWNDTQTDTMAVPMGVMNANGTRARHPVAHAVQGSCHENLKPPRILGFSAIELDRPAANAGETHAR